MVGVKATEESKTEFLTARGAEVHVSMRSLAGAKRLFLEAGNEAIDVMCQPSAEFKTASGAPVPVSRESVTLAQEILGERPGFVTGRGEPVAPSESALRRTRVMVLEAANQAIDELCRTETLNEPTLSIDK